jgi:hypothetical protein
MKDKSSFIRVARLFVVIGAILMIVLGLLSVVGRVLSLPFYPQAGLASVGYIIMSLFGGLVALVLSPKTGAFPWNLLLIVIGIVGGGLGGLLVLIGGVTALITRLT